MTLAEFLLARIAEDETVARRNWDGLPVQSWSLDDDEGYASVIIAAPRVLAECDAKRRIIADYGPLGERRLLELLALPYADHPDYRHIDRPVEWASDHPDYREEWKP